MANFGLLGIGQNPVRQPNIAGALTQAARLKSFQEQGALRQRAASQDSALAGELAKLGGLDVDPSALGAANTGTFIKTKNTLQDRDQADRQRKLQTFVNLADDTIANPEHFEANRATAAQLGLLEPGSENAPLDMGKLQAARDRANAQLTAGQLPSDLPSSVQEYNFFNKLSPQDQERFLTMKRANRPVDAGGSLVVPSQVNPGQVAGEIPKTLRPGERPTVKGEQAAAAAQGAAAGKRAGTEPQRLIAAQSALSELNATQDVVLQDIDRVLDMVGTFTTGAMGAGLSAIPGTAAFNLAKLLDGIRANIGFDKLQAMRDASPTGGALGQVSEKENTLLQSVLGSLEQSQTEGQFRFNLNRLKKILANRRKARLRAYKQDFGKSYEKPAEAAPSADQVKADLKSKYGLE